MRFKVENKKNGEVGVAVDLGNGRYALEVGGENKEVAASTFKRWYKVLEDLGETNQPTAEVVEEVKEELKVDDVVSLTKDGYLPVGKITGILKDTATVQAVTEDGEVEEIPVGVNELELATDKKQIKKVLGVLKKASNGNTPKQPKTAKKEPKQPKEPKVQNAAKEKLLDMFTQAEGIAMVDREFDTVKSKYGEKPKYHDTFNFYGFKLVVTYLNNWGSSKAVLYSKEGLKLYTSPNGTLKPIMEVLNFSEEQMKEVRKEIRAQRKAWDLKGSEQK